MQPTISVLIAALVAGIVGVYIGALANNQKSPIVTRVNDRTLVLTQTSGKSRVCLVEAPPKDTVTAITEDAPEVSILEDWAISRLLHPPLELSCSDWK